MDQFFETNQGSLGRRLQERLVQLADPRRDPQRSGEQLIGNEIVTYCALARERIVEVRTEIPLLGIVLYGQKEVWLGDVCQRLYPGDAFLFPANLTATAVNIPDERTGRYETLIMRMTDPPPQMARLGGRRRAGVPRARLDLTEELVEALAHAATIRANSNSSIANHRLTEVLMLIADQPAAAPLFDASAATAVAGVVLNDPARDWTAAEIGAKLGVGGSTLRRRLDQEQTSLRDVLRQIRLDVAHELLTSGTFSVAQAADAAGYTSRSHFARAFRETFGKLPSNTLPG